MFSQFFHRRVARSRRRGTNARSANPSGGRPVMTCEPLESRMLLSETAAAQLALVSTTGTPANPVYNYDITVTNTGTTNLGTFWFAWVPGEDLLPSVPLSESSPANWSKILTGTHNAFDGSGIQWTAQSASAALLPGQSLGGFSFSSSDSPAALNGASPKHPELPVETAVVYAGGPLSDAGFQFTVAGPATGSTAASVASLTAPASSVNQGDAVQLTATVSPAAPGGASPTGTVSFASNGTVLGSAPVQGNGTAVFSTSSLAVGVDSMTASYGGDSNYSAATSSAVLETVTAVSTPVLLPAVVRSTLPATMVAGAPVRGVVSASVTNLSSSAVKGPVTIGIYAATDGAIDGTATLIAQVTRRLNLKPGKTIVVSVPIKSLPSSLDGGTYTLLARSTDPSSQNNDSAAGPTIQLAAAFISLSESFTKLTLGSTVVAGTKTHAVAALRITNNGNIAASGAAAVSVYAAPDGTVDGSATLIKRLVKTLRIRPGKSVVVTLPLGLIPTLPPGAYAIVAQVLDPLQQTSSVTAVTPVNVTTAG